MRFSTINADAMSPRQRRRELALAEILPHILTRYFSTCQSMPREEAFPLIREKVIHIDKLF